MSVTFFIHLPMKMEPIRSSETSAIKTQTPGNYPKRNILQLKHGESLKTSMVTVSRRQSLDMRCLVFLTTSSQVPGYCLQQRTVQAQPVCGLGYELDDSRFDSKQDKENCLCCLRGPTEFSDSSSTRRPFAGDETAVTRSPPLTSIFQLSGAIPLFTPNAFMSVPDNLRSDLTHFRSHLSLTSCIPTLW